MDLLEQAQDAMARHSWTEAFEMLTEVDATAGLGPEALEILGDAFWWLARINDCINARERAYAGYLEADNKQKAGLMCIRLAEDHFIRLAESVGRGWLNRAERLLAGDTISVEYGWLARLKSVIAFEGRGDVDEALNLAQVTYETATRVSDRDLQALSLHDQGRAMVAKNLVNEGMELMEEAMIDVVAGELGALATGKIYCNMIDICEKLADYRRANEWDQAARRWCQRVSNESGFPGVCRVKRAEIMRFKGAWAEAEAEARRGCEELSDFPGYAAVGLIIIGEIRLRSGDLSGAEKAFKQAHELGRDPQPGLALLRLAEGKHETARELINSALDDDSLLTLERARLLPPQVEIALALDEMNTAARAVEELERIADEYQSTVLRAAAAQASGLLALAKGDVEAAEAQMLRAWKLWAEADVPYEAAQARVQLGQAYQKRGAQELSRLEFQAAHRTFSRLGAKRDLAVTRSLLGEEVERSTKRVVRAMMFTDIVGSTNLINAIGDEAWNHLVRWHDQTLRSLFATHGGTENDHAGDGFFVVFPTTAAAANCAIDIQRTLRRHRAESGFAPEVRIGIHAAEVTETDESHTGLEVHKAARIAALAGGGEILASADVGRDLSADVNLSSPRPVKVKGVADSCEVVTLVWQPSPASRS
ncbi:MAG: adenylate/guanylate cyclase domain-containing protein [Dehalococcoidales bacterium]